jgi:EpsI family protein
MYEAVVASASSSALVLPNGVRVKEFMVSGDGQPHYVTYWYVLNGHVVADDYQVKVENVLNWLSRGQTEGAVAVVRLRARSGEPVEAARTRAQGFVMSAMSGLASHLHAR